MRLYLTLLLLTLAVTYRFTRKTNFDVPAIPDDFFYLQSDLLVTQLGRDITVWNATNFTPVQKFTADSDNPVIQVSPETKKVLFVNNNSVFQIQDAKEAETLEVETDEVFWVYRLGTVENYTILHTMSNAGNGRSIYYLDIYDEVQYRNWSEKVSGENVVAGSGVKTISQEEYYFASGGFCSKAGQEDIFMLYEGDSSGIENVYNFSVAGCNYPEDADHKEEWDLTSIDIGGGDRWHAFSYALDREKGPRWYTTQVIARTNGVTSEVLRFDTSRLIGAQFLNKKLYTADDELCRIIEHRFENYLNSTEESSYLPTDVTETVLSYDEAWLVGLTGTGRAYLLSRLNDSYVLEQTIDAPNNLTLAEAYFSNDTLIVFKDNFANLHMWDAVNRQLSSATIGSVDDYCVTDGSMVFTFTKDSEISYTLHVLSVQISGQNLDLVEISSRALGYATSDLLCLGTQEVLVNPVNFGDPIRMWKYNTTFTNTASLIKLQTLHDKVYRTSSYIFFTNTDQRTTPVFYDYNLFPIGVSSSIMMAPDTVYRFLRTSSNYLIVAVGDDVENIVALDSYELIGSTITYRGSFSLLSNRVVAKVGRMVVLPATSRIHIDDSGAPYKVHNYGLEMPPQYLRGTFYDATELDCNGYSNALFRVNPVSNLTEMIAINGLESTPVIERFQFSNNTARLVNTAYIENYLYTKLSIALSTDNESIIVYGIKKTNTLVNCIQIRSSTNLADITFEKLYHEEMDTTDIQAFGLVQNNVFAAVINSDGNITEEHYIKILNEPNSGGKVSTGEVGEVITFSSCTKCNFIAVVGSLDKTKIYLTNVNSGVLIRTVDARCVVELVSLNADGTIVGYMCTSKILMTFETQIEVYHSQSNIPPLTTEIKVLSANSMIVTQNGVIYQITLNATKLNNDKLLSKRILQSNADIHPEVDYNKQSFAYKTPNSIVFKNYQGEIIDTFPLAANEQPIAIAFAPNSELAVLTTQKQLIMITPDACLLNYTQTEGYCICDPSFDQTGAGCQCSPQHYYENLECKCEDGKFFASTTNCADCSAFCSTCTTGDGIGDCDSYGAAFFIMIIGICLAVIVAIIIIIVVVMRSKKNATKRKTSDFGGDEKLVEEED